MKSRKRECRMLTLVGTLTMNHMTTTKIWFFGADNAVDVDSLDEAADAKADVVTLRILRIGNIANNGRLNRLHQSSRSTSSVAVMSSTESSGSATLQSRWVGQPTDVAMLDLLDRLNEHDVRDGLGHRIGETPFSSERKWMGVTVGDGSHDGGSSSKEVAYIKGAVDRVLSRCDTYLTRDGREVVLDSLKRQEALDAAEKLAVDGLRVLGFASGPVGRHAKSLCATSRATPPTTNTAEPHVSHGEDVYKGLVFAGLVGMSDPPRPRVKKAIRRLMRGGVKIIMITGDAETTALAIGKKLGMAIATPREHTANQNAVRSVLSGAEIDEMSDEELKIAIANTSIFARTSPDHKMKIVRALQARGDIVAMTGDGVNDAPALKKADIGISMGRQGTDVAKEAADMILTDDDFSTILKAIEEGKGIFNNIQNFLTFQLSTSAAALSLVFLCTCFGFKNPLNAMQILWISTPPPLSTFFHLTSHTDDDARHHNGRTPCAIPRRRARRRRRDDPAPAQTQRARPHAAAHLPRAHIGHAHHARHAGRLHPRDDDGQPGHEARHDHDLHVLRALRHVQRAQLPLGGQVGVARRGRPLQQLALQLGRQPVARWPGTRHLLSLAAGRLPNGGARPWRPPGLGGYRE